MSWAEIKKAVNSNLDIPLNKLVSGANVKLVGGAGSIPTTVIDITGKGLLNAMIIKYANMNGTVYTPYIKLEIDGEVYYDVALSPGNTYGSAQNIALTFANANCGFYDSDNIQFQPLKGMTLDIAYAKGVTNREAYIPFSSQQVQVSKVHTDSSHLPFNGIIADQSIPFSKSLKITTSTAHSHASDSWYVNYTLLD